MGNTGGASHTGAGVADMASSAMHQASDAAAFVGQRAADMTAALGSKMQSLGSTIRQHAPQGLVGNAGSAVADSLENGGRYLQEHGLQGVSQDVGKLIRNNPIPAVLVGIGLGFMLARATRS